MSRRDGSRPDEGAAEADGPALRGPGTVRAIHLVRQAGDDPSEVDEVFAVAGRGLEGDRYSGDGGTWSDPDRKSEVTLIEHEAVEEARRELGRPLDPGDLRRNVVTGGVRLSGLLGRRFRVGEVVMEGQRPCEPCGYLERRTGVEGVRDALRGRGGLRARVVRGGVLRKGDAVEPLDA